MDLLVESVFFFPFFFPFFFFFKPLVLVQFPFPLEEKKKVGKCTKDCLYLIIRLTEHVLHTHSLVQSIRSKLTEYINVSKLYLLLPINNNNPSLFHLSLQFDFLAEANFDPSNATIEYTTYQHSILQVYCIPGFGSKAHGMYSVHPDKTEDIS